MSDNLSLRPVNDLADVLAIVPSFLRPDDPAPVRDAILKGLTALCCESQEWAEYAAAQADILRSTGKYEDAIGAEHELFRNGAADEPYRDVLLTPPDVVTPTAILTAVNTILGAYSGVTARYCVPRADGIFLRDETLPVSGPGACTYYAFLYDENEIPRSPDYADRMYESEGYANGGLFIPGREPGAARLFADTLGRLFFLRVPDLSAVDAQDTPVYAESQANDFYVGTSAPNSWTSYVLQAATTSADLYAQIINVVNRIKGQSMRWILFVDPQLVS